MSKLVFIVDDEISILKLLTHWFKSKWGYDVETFKNGNDVLEALSQNPDLILLDIMLPDINGNEVLKKIKSYNSHIPVIMLSAQGSVEVAIESIRLGAFDYFPKPIDHNRLEPTVKNALKNYELIKRIDELEENLQKEYSFDNIISNDDSMQKIFHLITKVLDNDITVLIEGESGTGKELIARAIHFNGSRKDKAFIVVNCASIPRELLESELFGHEKGAFTGAHQKKIGKFELGDGGTIFLDEIGDLEMSLQAKILRVIQHKEFERVGGTEVIKTDVRILSATNRDLREAVEEKEFREDLYYRLSSFPIHIPPLRERRGDIIILIDYFLKKFNDKLDKKIKGFKKDALQILYDYNWPGNIRELENLVERCIILSDEDYIDKNSLPPQIQSPSSSQSVSLNNQELFSDTAPIVPFEKLKEEAVKHAVKVTNGNIVEAAKKLNIGRATLYRLMDKYRIEANREN